VTSEQLPRALDAQPFIPFTICTADGQRIRVPHREFISAIHGPVRTIIVTSPDGTRHIIDLLLVATLEIDRPDDAIPSDHAE